MNGARDIGVSSHFPVLAAAVGRTNGPILELGSGWGSTPMLRLMCAPTHRQLESYDNNESWAKQMGTVYVPNWDKWEPKLDWYDVAFIDCSPGEERKLLAMRLKDRAKFIIMHDHEAGPAAAYYYEHIIDRFKYNQTYRVLRPHTLILSDYEQFWLSEWDQERDNG